MALEIPETDYPPTVPGLIWRCAREMGERDFVVTPERRLTYGDAEVLSRRFAKQLLAAGAGKGTRVGATFASGVDWVVAWLGVSRIGAIYMPFSTAYPPPELRHVLRYGDVDTLVVPAHQMGRDHLAYIEEAVPGLADHDADSPLRVPDVPFLRSVWVSGDHDRAWARSADLGLGPVDDPDHGISDAFLEAVESEVTPADWMMTVFTSGTTSAPKAVVHTHGAFVRHGANQARFTSATPESRMLCAMPFFWIGGIGLAIGIAMAAGSAVLCTERFDPEVILDLMEAEHATSFGSWSHLRQRLQQHITATGRDVSAIPAFTPPAPGSPEATPGVRHGILGMTETLSTHSNAGPETGRLLPEELRDSIGLVMPGVERRVVDPATNEVVPDGVEGELCIRGYSVMVGMYKRERHEVFDADGWYHTGDKGWSLEGGRYFVFKGRLTEMIKSSGANVAPREVEVVLESFPEVSIAVVMGLPDEERGEIVGAVLVPQPGATVDPQVVVDRLAKELSSYKVPRRVLVLGDDEIPTFGNGKPDKPTLKGMLAEQGLPVVHGR